MNIMIFNNILKIVILFGLVFLLINTILIEKFDVSTYEPTKPITISLSNNDKYYSLISYDQLKPEIKAYVNNLLLNNQNFMNQRENVPNVTNNILYKTPIFLINNDDKFKFINDDNLNITLRKSGDNFILSPESDKYIYNDTSINMMYYSVDSMSNYLLELNQDGFIKPEYITPIINISVNNESLTLYSLNEFGNNESLVTLNIT